ncbi:hypothetical protein BS333_03390 [Vibrio azureus]|uniref:Uncharacterized protein n=2 Tax=Vibrio azureus TaxID=512649 RepID=U3ADV0_9VIBR|nr:hypothetical protein [Vibrio azureus]AUI85502.1 hypothetical protein BS333_03390 [Vibrio azureus]GAD78096.1 hypothetical protein VAZ01S_123_00010 [Vibrio azureus NBRC 104587]
MYMPLENLPILTEEYMTQKKQEAFDSSPLYEFTLIKEKPNRYAAIVIWFFLSSIVVWFAIHDPLVIDVFYMLSAILIISIACMQSYYADNPKTEQKVTLNEKGFIVTEMSLLPDFYYKSLRYSGYLGIAIAVVGTIIAGPLILAGAGAGIFAAFKMYKVKNVPNVQVCPFNSDIQYEVYPVSAVRYKHNLKELRFSPNIVMEGERPQLFRRNRNFYSIDFAINEEVKYRFFQQLEKIVNVVEVEEFRTPEAS